ncbi:MAG: type IV toxin-antitoxin system AbiEi family antitoxin [Actinomycetota bacterium]|nr:type IV toxin-antitoxin system AbiEi family antitoxin [Actinomycetota bacterium]
MRTLSAVPIARLRDDIVGRGISALTLNEVVALTGLTRGSAREAMRRTRAAGHFFAPTPGLYIPIPSEYSSWGVVPAMDFIDQMMGFLGRSYCVGLLSAAELHGAAHQRPQVFQVMVDRPLANRDIERVRLRFYERVDVGHTPVVLKNSRTSQVRVSSPETTVLDLVDRPRDSGALFNVATVIGEFVQEELLDAETLVALASSYPLATARRLGWLLDRDAEFVETTTLSAPLQEFVNSRTTEGKRSVDMLDASGPRRGKANKKWGIIENVEVEPDL